jgi:hypothetical protein
MVAAPGCEMHRNNLVRGNTENSKERTHGQALDKDRENYYTERQVQDFLTIGKRAGHAQGKREGQGAAQPSPHRYMLPTKGNLLGEAIAHGNEQIDR